MIVSPFHDDDDDDEDDRKARCSSRMAPFQNTIKPTEKKPKAWSVRARRDVPNLLRGDR